MIVDECWVTVGSANFDNRSLRLNEEANLNVLDSDFAAQHKRIFDVDRSQSREITLADWLQRPLAERMIGRSAGLFRSQM